MVIPGSKRMKTLFGWCKKTNVNKDDKKGRKRHVRLEVEEDEGSKTDTRIQQPSGKKAKEDTNGY